MAGTTVKARGTGLRGSDVVELNTQHTAVIADLENIRAALLLLGVTRGHVLPNQTAAGLSVDANAQDVETDNTVFVKFDSGMVYSVAATAAIDISALTAAGDTVAINKYGALWVFVNAAGTVDVETSVATETSTSAIAALASYATSTNTLPPLATQVPIGVVYFLADGGAHTWGTTSITSQTETYVDFLGLPGVESAAASLALDAAAATFTYGATVVRLGSGVRIAATGKANATITGSVVAHGDVGAWLLYILADDVEYAQQLGEDYATLAAAQEAVRDHNPNPYLAHYGTLYVENESGLDFTPGTTNLDATGITATFVTIGTPASTLDAVGDLTAALITTYA